MKRNKAKKKVCIFTGTRAEYGLLSPLMEEIKNDKELFLQIIASGMHLSPEFGSTYKEIEKNRFTINEKIGILSGSDTPTGICKAIGLGVAGYSEAYKRLNPDLIIILGDRFEGLAAAIAAMISRIPIAHLYGGESTFGLIDEAVRHSITKMSQFHFTAIGEYRKRVIQLGEHPGRVFNVGALGIDNIKKLKLLSRKALEKKLCFKFNKRNLLVTFHPVTLENNTSKRQFHDLLVALDSLNDTFIIFTKANADTFGRIINKMIDEYASKNPHKCLVFASMGQLNYLSMMRSVDAVVGNSSSGIIEAPSFKIGTINIGDRQKGRIRAASVIDCEPDKYSILKAFGRLYSKEFQRGLAAIKNPYDGGGLASVKIKNIIKNTLKRVNKDNILKKEFYDINLDTEK